LQLLNSLAAFLDDAQVLRMPFILSNAGLSGGFSCFVSEALAASESCTAHLQDHYFMRRGSYLQTWRLRPLDTVARWGCSNDGDILCHKGNEQRRILYNL